jgi:hypothetical protein
VSVDFFDPGGADDFTYHQNFFLRAVTIDRPIDTVEAEGGPA